MAELDAAPAISNLQAAALTSSHISTSTAATHIPRMTADYSDRNAFEQLGHALLLLSKVVPGVLYSGIAFTTITLPTWLFNLFSSTLTFTMNFTTLLLIVLSVVSIVSYFIRYRFLNVYSRLPQAPQMKEPEIDLFPDSQDGDSKPGISNYLDEFLSAIKVFGYLERPVFHELTRSMQTKKLIAGETVLLEEEKGFCLVVDGCVQIFVKSLREEGWAGRGSTEDEEEGYHEGNQGYRLLTEVRNGASLSSLFSILSLFTESIKLHSDRGSDGTASNLGVGQTPDSAIDTPISFPTTPMHQGETPTSYMTVKVQSPIHDLPHVPPLTLEAPFDESRLANLKQNIQARARPSAHPDIVARALVDTTIAVIPASAFRRLTRVYPKATAHIVQVILTRLQRVTLSTAHQYLGLTAEVLQIEKLMNKYTNQDLPNHLLGDALNRLKDKFAKERSRIGEEEITKGIALHHPVTAKRRSSSSLRKEAALAARLATARNVSITSADSIAIEKPLSTNVSAGDLMRSSQQRRPSKQGSLSFSSGHVDNAPSPLEGLGAEHESPIDKQSSLRPSLENGHLQRQTSAHDDSVFRESILDCMVKSLGVDDAVRTDTRRNLASVEQSPRMVSYDAKRQTAIFSNAFGFMDPYDNSVDGDTESINSTAVSHTGSFSSRSLHDELIDDIEIVFFPQGAVLVEQGERNPGVYYVIDGFLDVSTPVEHKDDRKQHNSRRAKSGHGERVSQTRRPKAVPVRTSSIPAASGEDRGEDQKSLFLVKPGGVVGYLGTLSSYRSFTNVTAKTDVYVGFLPRASLERVAEKHPVVLLTMAKRLTSVLPRLILHIDFALEWVQVSAGQAIYHQGDESDAIYRVLNGRLRMVRQGTDDAMHVGGEYGQGESIGELEVMTEGLRPGTLHAIRDTELAKIPKTLFNSLAQEHPAITMQISKLIAQRMRVLTESHLGEGKHDRKKPAGTSAVNSTMNLRTVAVLPITTGVPIVDFGNRLLAALSQVGVTNGVTLLNQAMILSHLGRHAFSRMGRLKLSQYLADLEERYGMVLYVADTSVNAPWTQTCITQADCILLVGVAESSPNIGEYERFLLGMKSTARKELVLLHFDRYFQAGLTRKWLRNRVWINGGHHHIQMPGRTSSEAVPSLPQKFGVAIRKQVQVIQAEIQKYTSRRVRQKPIFATETPFKSDFHRLARRLCGKSVGLVLGGGGARGLAHVGIIQALEEAGIPIDIVGGTSIGALIGGLYARDADAVPMLVRIKQFAGRMSSMWRFVLDLTYPSASYTTGHEFNRGIFKCLGDSQIEDFRLSFYCNTTNISKSRAEIHSSGYAWRYIRASMSLAGLIPPLCDEGNMLLDGGYIDNLTVAHMKSLGADLVFAVDVGAVDDDVPQQFGDSMSGFWAVLNRYNPFSGAPNPPTLGDIQARLAYVSSYDALERAKATPGCLYMRPAIEAYGTLEFGKFEEIFEIGYAYGREFLANLKNQGALEGVISAWDESEEGQGLRRTMAPRRASI